MQRFINGLMEKGLSILRKMGTIRRMKEDEKDIVLIGLPLKEE